MKGFSRGLLLMPSACGSSTLDQALRPDQPTSVTTTNPRSQVQNKRGLIVTDNPYTISSDRLEKMNKAVSELISVGIRIHELRAKSIGTLRSSMDVSAG
jgi:hypothetical protein